MKNRMLLMTLAVAGCAWVTDAEVDGKASGAGDSAGHADDDTDGGADTDTDGGSDTGSDTDTDGCVEVPLYADGDADGWGDDEDEIVDCPDEHPERVTRGGDCDDSDADRSPGLTEICGNETDEDCDEQAPPCSWDGDLDLADAHGARIDGEIDYASIASALADAGDLDGDGDTELILGSGGPYSATGRLWIAHGDPSLDGAGEVTTADIDTTVVTGTATTSFGTAAWGTGDLDGDGRGSFVATQPLWPTNTDRTAAALLWFDGLPADGATAADASRVFTLEPNNMSTQIGMQAHGGYVAGGQPALVFGVADWDGLGGNDGRAWLVLNPTAGADPVALDDGDADVVFDAGDMTNGSGANRKLGAGVQLCDFDGDGESGVVVSAATGSGDAAPAAAYVFHDTSALGARPSHADADAVVSGPLIMGTKLRCGDLDGDGVPELVVHSPKDDVEVYPVEGTMIRSATGGLPINPMASPYWQNVQTEGRQAGTFAIIPDPMGTGRDMVAIGDPYGGDDGASKGKVWIMDGLPYDTREDINATAVATVFDTDNANAGMPLMGLGDVDGDGYGDLAIGSASMSIPARDAGRVWLLFGGD